MYWPVKVQQERQQHKTSLATYKYKFSHVMREIEWPTLLTTHCCLKWNSCFCCIVVLLYAVAYRFLSLSLSIQIIVLALSQKADNSISLSIHLVVRALYTWNVCMYRVYTNVHEQTATA